MHLFDSHFHYGGEAAPQEYRHKILTAALAAGVFPETLELNAVGGDLLESCRAREFAHAIPDCVFSAGVHPHGAASFNGDVKKDFSVFQNDPKLAAIGEIGLDYYYEGAPPEQQKKLLADFLELALEWQKPAILHLRDQGDDSALQAGFDLLRPFAAAGGRFVVHCFTGSPEWGEKFLELGGYLGVTGMVTFRRAENIRELAVMIPDDRLLIETDAPYLAPLPYRGKENHPGFLGLIAAKLAEIRNCSIDDIASLSCRNARTLFGIDSIAQPLDKEICI